MRKIFPLFTCLWLALGTIAQDDTDAITGRIVEEGKRLYRSEMASWYGTDIFLEKFKDRDKIGGYFSYMDGSIAKCIFFSKVETPKVIGTISFDSTYNVSSATADLAERDFTALENDLFRIHYNAMKIINSDTLFKVYKNTSLNVIPIIANGEKKVYVLTGPKASGVVIIGNDYLLTFDEQNQLTSTRRLHKNILMLEYGKAKGEDGKGTEIGAAHTHLPETGEFITATDVCTLMLYAKFAGWQQHMVVSQKYINIWNCQTNKLIVITQEAFDKINKDQEKRRKRN